MPASTYTHQEPLSVSLSIKFSDLPQATQQESKRTGTVCFPHLTVMAAAGCTTQQITIAVSKREATEQQKQGGIWDAPHLSSLPFVTAPS